MTDRGADWFRNTDWSPEIAGAFQKRLTRARGQRDEYLAIQAMTLAGGHPQAALELSRQFFETRQIPFRDSDVFWTMATAYRRMGDFNAAVEHFLKALDVERQRTNVQGLSRFDLPYMVAVHGLTDWYDTALKIQQEFDLTTPFPMTGFQVQCARALIAADRGQGDAAQEAAAQALELAGQTSNAIGAQDDIGLVGEVPKDVLCRLRQLAHGTRPWWARLWSEVTGSR